MLWLLSFEDNKQISENIKNVYKLNDDRWKRCKCGGEYSLVKTLKDKNTIYCKKCDVRISSAK